MRKAREEMMKNFRDALSGVAVAAALATTPAAAKEVRIVIGAGGDGALQQGMDFFAGTLEEKTGGDLTGRVFKGALLPYAETPKGLSEGVADVAHGAAAYRRGDCPIGKSPSELYQ